MGRGLGMGFVGGDSTRSSGGGVVAGEDGSLRDIGAVVEVSIVDVSV
jgi:hypothetical protein